MKKTIFLLLTIFSSLLMADTKLEEILLKKGIITQAELDDIKKQQNKDEIELRRGINNTFGIKTKYDKGLIIESLDGNWKHIFNIRTQARYSNPYRSDPRTLDHFSSPDESTFELRRVRFKGKGHAYKPWINYAWEIDVQPTSSSEDSASGLRLITWYLDFKKWDPFKIKLGQWKINYNRERVDSSGKQQFIERSIVNRIFTIDRQVGIMAYGNLFRDTPAHLTYYAGVFNGEGRGIKNDDNNMMYMGRLQWNMFGKEMKYSQSDVERHEDPIGSLSFSIASNEGVCTRWSSSGCGSLDGFNKNNIHGIFQIQQGSAFKWNGFSWQQEYHWKNIEVPRHNTKYNLNGLYAQAGYFPNEILDLIPEELEIAYRYARVEEPSVYNKIALTNYENIRQEYTIGLNYFIDGHRNKISFDASYLTLDDGYFNEKASDRRFRVQWDFTF